MSVNNPAVILSATAKLYLEGGEDLLAIERSGFSPEGHEDPAIGIVTRSASGEVRGWWTSAAWCRRHPLKRFSMMAFATEAQAVAFIKANSPAHYNGKTHEVAAI